MYSLIIITSLSVHEYNLFDHLTELVLDLGIQCIQLLHNRLLSLRRRLWCASAIWLKRKKKGYLKLHLRELEHEVAGPILDFRKRYVALALTHSPNRRVVEADETFEHAAGLVKRTVAVVLAHAILLQEVVLEHAGNLERDLVIFA
jgi:hypothetical protein